MLCIAARGLKQYPAVLLSLTSSNVYRYLPRDAMLARYMLSSCVRLSVRPSVTSRYSIETTGRIELVLAWRLPSTYPTLCYDCGNSTISEIIVLPSGTLSRTADSGKFRHGK